MSITLCMIVKNEEKYIEMCLENAMPLVDDAIIVDTGSTDRTKEIIKSYGDKIELIETTWENNFSKARNMSIERAKGDWILVIDADEKVIFDKESLIKQLGTTDKEGFNIPIYNLVNTTSITYTCLYCKLYRKKGYKYVGEIHELISVPIEQIEDLKPEVCKVIHYGYLEENFQAKDKTLRNLTIAKSQYKKHSKDPNAMFNLANSYIAAKDYQKALDFYIKCYNLSNNKANINVNVILINIASCLFSMEKYEKCISFINEFINKFEGDNKVEFLYLLGVTYLNMEKYEDSINAFRKCIEIGEVRGGFNTLGKGSYLSKLSIARIYIIQNKKYDAAMEYIEALFDKHNIFKIGREEAIEYLKNNNMKEILDELMLMLGN